jgi:hypothetical protein
MAALMSKTRSEHTPGFDLGGLNGVIFPVQQ